MYKPRKFVFIGLIIVIAIVYCLIFILENPFVRSILKNG